MNIQKTKNHKISVDSINENLDIINQETLTIQQHSVVKKYRILSKNNNLWEGKYPAPGYFNKKTNFIIGEKNSIIVVDENLNIQKDEDSNTSNIINRNSDFLLYNIPCFTLPFNKYLIFEKDDKVENIYLTKELGIMIGEMLAKGESKHMDIPLSFTENIFVKTNGLGLAKNILINTNHYFVLGILKGYYNISNNFIIEKDVNRYTFTTLLNYLGASYTIFNFTTDEGEHKTRVYFKLPQIFYGMLPDKFVIPYQYYVNESHKLVLEKEPYTASAQNTIEGKINIGTLLAVPVSSLQFETIEEDCNMYDLTCERYDATNYALKYSPFLKNSDGDILAASGLYTKFGLESAQKFSPENKEYYRDLNSGNINVWVADDALLGLYNATSQVKK